MGRLKWSVRIIVTLARRNLTWLRNQALDRAPSDHQAQSIDPRYCCTYMVITRKLIDASAFLVTGHPSAEYLKLIREDEAFAS